MRVMGSGRLSSHRDPRTRRAVGDATRYVALGLGAVALLLPFGWSCWIALTDRIDGVSLQNFQIAWERVNFDLYAATTFAYSILSAAGATVLAAFAGYAFARLRFPGRRVLFSVILAAAMIPIAVYVLPLFLLMVHFPLVGGNDLLGQGGAGFYDTFAGLVLPGLTSTTSVFLMRQFFRTLPRELEDAAKVDGASVVRTFLQVMLPLAKPGLVVVFVLQFQDSWNAYLWPLVIGNSQELWTVQVGLSAFNRLAVFDFGGPGVLQAGALIASVPVIVLFLVAQRQFRQGIALTGLK